MFDKKVFGERLRYFRNERNLTLNEFSELADISNTYLSSIESGNHTPTIDVIVSILNALSIDYQTIMGETNSDSSLMESIISYLPDLDDNDISFISQILKELKKYQINGDKHGS